MLIEVEFVVHPLAEGFLEQGAIGALRVVLLDIGAEVRLEDARGAHREEIFVHNRDRTADNPAR